MNINKDTLIYGSFSDNPGNNGCIFFNNLFQEYKINAIYKSFYSTNAEELIRSAVHLNFSGFALSMPLKIKVMKYLNEIDPAALEIGAVNTVINKNGYLIGYNTDWLGVYNYFINGNIIFPDQLKLTILGDGGFSKAVQYVCKKLIIPYDIITRENWNKIDTIKNPIFNATPVDVKANNLIDGRPWTETGKIIANLQAKEQFYLYTGIKI